MIVLNIWFVIINAINLMKSIQKYYRVKNNKDLFKSIVGDLLVTLFLSGGTGLFLSIVKGFISHLFIKSGKRVLIGKRFKVKHPSNIRMGSNINIKDDVSILADGPILIGDNFIVGERSTLTSTNHGLKIGNNVVIGKDCYLAQNGGSLTIGNNVLIADGVRFYTLNHMFEDTKTPIIRQKVQYVNIEIKDNVWIGAGAVIFNNVIIESGSVIGANTIVRKNVPRFSVFGGNPGKVLRYIKKKNETN